MRCLDRPDAGGVVEVMEDSPLDEMGRSERKSHSKNENGAHPGKLGHPIKERPGNSIVDGLRSTEIETRAARGKRRRTAKLTLREIYLDKPEAYERLIAHRVLAAQIEAGAYHKLYSARRRLKSMFKQSGGDPATLFVEDFSPPTYPINWKLSDMQHWAPLLGGAINGCPQNLYLFMRAPGEIGDRMRAVSPFPGIALLTKQCRAALDLSTNARECSALLTK
jgi:hypothetical protein